MAHHQSLPALVRENSRRTDVAPAGVCSAAASRITVSFVLSGWKRAPSVLESQCMTVTGDCSTPPTV